METDGTLRALVVGLLDGGDAHVRAADALKSFPPKLRGERPAGSPHSAWEILEHLRIAQHDIVRYCVDPTHESPEWPEGYWPKSEAPPDDKAWTASVKAFAADLREMRALVEDGKRDLRAPLPHASDTSILEEAFIVANHNSYHLGQLMLVRRMLGA